jgi:hypothetical protein
MNYAAQWWVCFSDYTFQNPLLKNITKIFETSFMPFATPYSPDPPVKRFLCHHNLLCFLIPWTRLIIINIQQHIQTQPSAAATMYKHFQASPISMDVGHSIFSLVHLHICQLGSVVGIVTGYGLDGPGIRSWWGLGFPHLSRLALGPTQPPVQ